MNHIERIKGASSYFSYITKNYVLVTFLNVSNSYFCCGVDLDITKNNESYGQGVPPKSEHNSVNH